MKKYYCVTSTFDDKGRVTANIVGTIEAESKPESINVYTGRRDIYQDWYGSESEARKAVKEALNA